MRVDQDDQESEYRALFRQGYLLSATGFVPVIMGRPGQAWMHVIFFFLFLNVLTFVRGCGQLLAVMWFVHFWPEALVLTHELFAKEEWALRRVHFPPLASHLHVWSRRGAGATNKKNKKKQQQQLRTYTHIYIYMCDGHNQKKRRHNE